MPQHLLAILLRRFGLARQIPAGPNPTEAKKWEQEREQPFLFPAIPIRSQEPGAMMLKEVAELKIAQRSDVPSINLFAGF